MPEEVDSCVEQVMADGHDEDSAYAICEASTDDKSFGDTELARMLKNDGAQEWVGTVGRLVRNDVEKTVIADVVERARSGGSRQETRSAMAKSAKIEKVGFEAEVHSQFTVFKAGDDDFIIWGPASVEVVDKEGDKIQAKALQKALPQLLKRARLSLEHSDQLVGRILERFETDDPVEVEIGDRTFKRSEFPTDVLEVEKMDPALYVAGEIYNDSRQARDTRKRIENGELDSYSISGEALVTQKKVTSDGESYDDIVDLDLSAVTICEEGMNQEAKFARIAGTGDKTASATAKSDDPVSPGSGRGESPTVSAVADLAKSAIDETMSDTDKSSDDSGGGFDPDALTTEFKSVLDSKLPDGELATKDDTLQREDVESIAREVYQKQEDEAGQEDQQDSGHSEAAGRPGEEADVTGEQSGTSPQAEPHDGTQKQEDEAGSQDDQDSGTSDSAGRPGDETDYPNTQGDAPDSEGENVSKDMSALAAELGVDEKTLVQMKELFSGKGDDEPMPPEEEEEDVPLDDEEAPPEPAPDEEKEGDEEEEDVPLDDEEVAPEEDVPLDDEEEEEIPLDDEEVPPDEEAKEGYNADELEEKLPADVWEVVREYLEDEPAAEPGGPSDGEEGEEVMAAAKSDDIESAVEKVLSGKGLEKAGGASAPSGDVEKSYDEDPENAPGHGNNPALATFYGE